MARASGRESEISLSFPFSFGASAAATALIAASRELANDLLAKVK